MMSGNPLRPSTFLPFDRLLPPTASKTKSVGFLDSIFGISEEGSFFDAQDGKISAFLHNGEPGRRRGVNFGHREVCCSADCGGFYHVLHGLPHGIEACEYSSGNGSFLMGCFLAYCKEMANIRDRTEYFKDVV